jgi:4-hydroxy-tetrahydrodipicolinate synthase
MSADEQVRVIERTVEVAAGRVPILAGAGTNDTSEACERARAAVRAGADAVLSVTPYYNKPTQEGLYRHFMAVAEAADAPVFVYTVPGRTSCNVLPETLFRLADGHPMIAGVKEASGDMSQVMAILKDRPEGFLVLSGEDHLTFPMIALGGDGVISVVANEVPARFSEMVDAALAADYARALEIHYQLLQLMQANFYETNPIPVKTALEIMGHHEAHFRLPLCEMSEKNRERLRQALEQAGVETRRAPGGSGERGAGPGTRVAAARAEA